MTLADYRAEVECRSLMEADRVVADLVAVLLRRPAWQRDALCAEYQELPWVGGLGEVTGPALVMMRSVCSRCLVEEECAAFAEGYGADLDGVWAGLTTRDRLRARQGR